MEDTVPRCETPSSLKGTALAKVTAEVSALSCTEPVIPNSLRIVTKEGV